MSLFKQNLAATNALLTSLLTFRAAPAGLCTVRDVNGVWRIERVDGENVVAVKQRAIAIKRAAGAGALPNDYGPSRRFPVSRIYPATMG